VWINPVTYENQYNMEGSLLYPGADAGVQGFITSIRLKQIREGLEDYEYLAILARRRGSAVAQGMVRKIARSWHDWDGDPRHLLEVRTEIARSIVTEQGVAAARSPSTNKTHSPGVRRRISR
jgi:hypothetical protein